MLQRQEVRGQFVTDILVPPRVIPLITVLPSINKHYGLLFLPCEAAHGGVCFAAVVMGLWWIKEPWAPTVLLLDRCVSLLLVSWCAGLCHAAKLNTAPARFWRWEPWLVVTLSSWVSNISFKTVDSVSLLVSRAKLCSSLGWTALFYHSNWQQYFFFFCLCMADCTYLWDPRGLACRGQRSGVWTPRGHWSREKWFV